MNVVSPVGKYNHCNNAYINSDASTASGRPVNLSIKRLVYL